MVQTIKMVDLNNNAPKVLIEATYGAVENFQVRAFFEAKEEIIQHGKFSEQEFYDILDSMIDAETERKIVLERLAGQSPLFIEEILKLIENLPPENVIRNIFYLKEQGYVEELVEIKTHKEMQKVKDEEKEVEIKEYFYRYQVKFLPDNFKEHFFEPVTIVFESGASILAVSPYLSARASSAAPVLIITTSPATGFWAIYTLSTLSQPPNFVSICSIAHSPDI